MANAPGLVLYAMVAAMLAVLVLFASRDRDFPMPLARRGAAVVLSLDAMLALIALGSDPDALRSPGWLMSLALMGAVNLVASASIFLRGVSMPSWLRGLTGVACLVAPAALALLVFEI